jgi:sugar O-acyltransferase (sialic acid O-acetyltransferase NeuD family)
LVIIGAGGLSKEILQVLHENNEEEELYFFDNLNTKLPDLLYDKFPLIRSIATLKTHFKTRSPEFILAIGGTVRRRNLCRQIQSCGGVLQSLIARSASVGYYGTRLDAGVSVLTQAIITTDVTIGEGTLINKAVIIGHDVSIGKYCEIAPGVRIMGRSRIGDYTQIATNAAVLPDTNIGSHCRVDAGCVVRNKIPDHAVVLGLSPKVFKNH